MERIRGKQSLTIDAQTLAALSNRYDDILIDIGTGDGRFVRRMAERSPACLAIGIDACRENLREASRRAPQNAVYLIANALALPPGLAGLATRITINFPWGSLLAGLLDQHAGLMHGLAAMARPGAELEVRLNAGALAEEGRRLDDGAARVRESLECEGFVMEQGIVLDADTLRLAGTTWAKRLAEGRDPRAIYMRGARYPQLDRSRAAYTPAFVLTGASAYGDP